MQSIVVIAHDIRSSHNVGSIFRTAEGLGIHHLYLTGYTPYPQTNTDDRLPHISQKLTSQISKTALGAENTLPWSHESDVIKIIETLRSDNYQIVALEQSPNAVQIPSFVPAKKIAVILGNEVTGVNEQLLDLVDAIIEIPMNGKKESFNVAQATAIALYHCRYIQDIRQVIA